MAKPIVKKPAKPAPTKQVVKKQSPDEINNKYADAAQRADSGDINRITLEKGENTIRLVDPDFRENYVAFIEDTEGNNKRISMGMNMADNKEKYAILFDTISDLRASHRYYFKAIQGKKIKVEKGVKTVLNNEIQLFEVGPQIFKQIAAIQTDPDFPDVHEINLKITRTGEKLKTDYQVMPSPKSSPLPTDLVGDVDLDALVEETPLTSVYEYLGEEFDESSEAETTDESEETVDDVVEETEEAEETTDEAEGDGFDDLDRKELMKYIKQYELGITIYKSTKDDEIRDLIRKKLQELEAESEEETTDEVEETEEVEETTGDDEVVEEDDLSDLDDLDDLEEETPPVQPKKPGKKK